MRQKMLCFFLLGMLHVVAVFAQDKKITGKVTHSVDGTGIPGVTVVIQGSTTGTQTNSAGQFSITAAKGKILVFRSIGFADQQMTVGESSTINVALVSQTDQLSEYVVVAFGKAKKESVTGAVSSITAKDIEKRPVANALGVLEGSAPGVQVNNTIGRPGSEPVVRIRGFSSVNGDNAPLYVIDGVTFSGNVSDINPNDIESISVLKDAAASALYGSRASNGVIIMTTKRASKNKDGNINFVMNQGVYTRGIKDYDMMNANEFMETMWKGYRNYLMSTNPTTYPTRELAGAKASSSLISDYLYLNIYDKASDQLFDANGKLVADARILPGYVDDLDWFKDIERTGHRQDYTLSGSAGGKKSSIYYSLGYLDEKGYVKMTDYKRFTGRINAEIQAKDWLKYGLNVAGSHQNSDKAPGEVSNAGSIVSPFNFARSIAPIYPVHLHDKTTGEYVLDASGNKQYDDGGTTRNQLPGRHSIWENELNHDKVYRNTLSSQAYIEAKFLRDFTFTFKGDLNVRNSDEATYNNALIGDGAGNKGRGSRENYRYKNYTVQQLLGWGKSYGLHTVDVLAGHEYYSSNYNYLYGYKTTETFAGQMALINFGTITDLYDYEVDYRTEGYFGRARYNYDEKYYVDGSFRRDASSKFYSMGRWGNFWSLGGGWILSKEKFFQPVTGIVNYAKLRASYGEVGNDASADTYAYMALYNIDQNNNRAALYKEQNEALNLIWETSSSVTVGLETRLLNRVNLTAEYFDKRSKNLLFNVYLPLSAGATSNIRAESTIADNLGTVSNRGVELSFDVDVVKNKDWRWNVGANATWMKNEIVTLPEQNRKNGIITGNYKYMEGHGVYDFFVYQYAGVDQTNGNALYIADDATYDPTLTTGAHYQYLVSINGKNYTTNPTYSVRNWSGSAIPKVYGAFNTSLTWKNISLSGIFTYSKGGKVYDDTYLGLRSMSGSVGQMHQDLLNAWDGAPKDMTPTSPNRIDPNGIPAVNFSRNTLSNTMSTQFLQDGSYFVIKNIALGYNLPADLLRRIDLSSVRVSASVENLATFTKLQGMSPQQSFNGRSLSAFVTPRIASLALSIGL